MKTSIPQISFYRLTALTLAVLAIAILNPLSAFTSDKSAPPAASEDTKGRQSGPYVDESYGKSPLRFEANQGQADPSVKFLARIHGYNLFLMSGEAVLAFTKDPAGRSRLRASLHAANPAAEIEGVEQLPGHSNYFIGQDPSRWRVNIPHYAKVRYKGVYPGIDLVYYGNQAQLEYDFVVAPGADPTAIKLNFEGARRLRINTQGDLVISSGAGKVRLLKPVIYQERDGRREIVEGNYVLHSKNRIGFAVAMYDKTRPLVIDPIVEYATFLGGSNDDRGLGLAVDAQGHAYVAGLTTSLNFPTANAGASALSGAADAFVTKLSPDGSSILWSTYYGGTGAEQARGIALDPQGNAYITGVTDSNNLPAVNAFQATKGSASFTDAFVAKLSAGSGALIYSTYLGGWRPETGDAIAVDSTGRASVTGNTGSYVNGTERAFPTTPGAFQNNFAGGNSASFVTRLTAAGNGLDYSTFLGGLGNNTGSTFGDASPDDLGLGIALDSSGNAIITGRTESEKFPVLNAAQPNAGGGFSDAFVTKLNSSGTGLIFSTFLGGAGEENRNVGAVAVGADDQIYLTGATNSINFPILNAIQASYGGNPENEAFVTKLDGSGHLVYSTYLGSSNFKRSFGIAVDRASNVYVTGTNLLRRLNALGTNIIYSQTLGAEGRSVALDAQSNVYVTGLTTTTTLAAKCTTNNFCPTPNAAQVDPGGGLRDAVVIKFAADNPKNVYIDFEKFPGDDGVYGTGDAGETCTQDGDDIAQRYAGMGVTFTLAGGGTPVINQPSLEYIPGSPRALRPMTADQYQTSPGNQRLLKDFDINFTPGAKRVRLYALNADEDWSLIGYNSAGVEIVRKKSEGGGDRSVRGLEIVAGENQSFSRVRVDICNGSDSCGGEGPESFDLLEFEPVVPPVRSNTRFLDFEKRPGPDMILGTADDTTDSQTDQSVANDYQNLGVVFQLRDGTAPIIRNIGSTSSPQRVLYPVSTPSGSQTLIQDLIINFTTPVSRVKFAALDADEAWAIKVYSRNGTLIRTIQVPSQGNGAVFVETRVDPCSATENLIGRVEIIPTKSSECCHSGPEYYDLLEFDVVNLSP